MLHFVRCIPFLGTAVTAVEAVRAGIDGDKKECVSKLVQTGIGGIMDAAFVFSGGLSSLATAPLKGGAIEGGKIAGQKVFEKILIEQGGKIVGQKVIENVAANVVVRAGTEYVASVERDSASGKGLCGSCQ